MPGGTNNYGTSPLAPTSSNPDLTIGSLTRGSGVTTSGTAAAKGWGGTGWNNSTADANITANKFITFTVSPNAGRSLSLSSLSTFDYRHSPAGPTSALIQYSIGSGSFTDITTVSLPSSDGGGSTAGPISLSGIAALQNIDPETVVTFRIIPFGASGATGTFYIFDVASSTEPDLAFMGTINLLSPTPVKFGNLKAAQTSSGINLQWSNLTETDVESYTLERSSNGRNFATLFQLAASKNHGGKADYQLLDASPLNGTNFYRIKAIETNGKTVYSDIARISIGAGKTLLNLYPNPVKGNFIGVQINNLPAGKYVIKIFNSSAQAVASQLLDHKGGSMSQTLSLNNLKPGVYTVEIGGAVKLQKQFIVQ